MDSYEGKALVKSQSRSSQYDELKQDESDKRKVVAPHGLSLLYLPKIRTINIDDPQRISGKALFSHLFPKK